MAARVLGKMKLHLFDREKELRFCELRIKEEIDHLQMTNINLRMTDSGSFENWIIDDEE
jgi:hypothetical protein